MDSRLSLGTNGMMQYTVTDEDKEETKRIFADMYPETNLLNKHTVYAREESRMAGILGEIVFANLHPKAIKSTTDLSYDFLLNDLKIDVKCKYRKRFPLMHFQASVFLYQVGDEFNANFYYFMSTIPTLEHVWLCGGIYKDEMKTHTKSETWRSGETDSSNGMTFRKDTLCLNYSYLYHDQLEEKE